MQPAYDPVVTRIARVRPSAGLRHWRNALFTIFALSGFVFASWASRVPAVRDLLHASPQEMGLLILGFSAGSIVGLLAASHIIARLGPVRTILVVCSAICVGMIALGLVVAFVPAFWPMVVALFVVGTVSIVDVSMNLSGAAYERTVGRALMPLFHASFSLGTVIGAGIGALLAFLGVPVAAHFIAVGVVALASSLLLNRFLQQADEPVDDGSRPAEGWRSRLAVWKDRRVLLIGLIVLGMAFAEGSANDWLSLATVGRIGGVFVLDRFGRVPVLRGSAGLAVLGLLLVILGPMPWLAVVGTVLWGVGASLGFPVGMSAAADDPRTATATVSAVATIGYLAFLVGPPLIGLLGQHLGILDALLVVLVLIAIGGVASSAAKSPDAIRRDPVPDPVV